MPGITLSQAESKLTLWMDAEDKVAQGQAYSIGDRSLTRADLRTIRDTITYWDTKVQKLSRGGIRVRRGVPIG